MSDDFPTFDRRAVLAAGAVAFSGCALFGDGGDGGTEAGGTPTGEPTGGTPTEAPETEAETETGTEAEETEAGEPPKDARPDAWNDLGEVVESFEDVSHWEAVGSSTIEQDDGSDGASPPPVDGGYSLRVEADGIAQAEATYDEPLDFSDRTPSFAMYADRPDGFPSLFVILWDEDGNSSRFLATYDGWTDGGWIRYDPRTDAYEYNDQMDFSRVARVRIRLSADSDARFWVDELRAVPRPDKGKVLVMFDDIPQSQYEHALPILRDHDVPAAVSVPTDLVGSSGRMSLDQLREFEDAGCELVSQSTTRESLFDLDEGELRDRLRRSHDWLVENAQNPEGAKHLAFPRSDYDERILSVSSEIYEMSYVHGSACAAGITDPRTVTRVNYDDYGPERFRIASDRMATHRELLVVVVRGLDGEERVQGLRDLCAFLDSRDDVDAISPSELLALQEELAGGS